MGQTRRAPPRWELTRYRRRGEPAGWVTLYYRGREAVKLFGNLRTTLVMVAIEIAGDDDEIEFTLAAGVYGNLKIRIPGSWAARLRHAVLLGVPHDSYDDVEVIRVSLHDLGVWWSLGHTTDSWNSKTPRWRNGSWHPLDTLLGRTEVEWETLSTHEVEIPMPEGTYRWRVHLKEGAWKRPRWPWARKHRTYEAEALEGQQIPVPGKGENSWDCGSDALRGCSGPARRLHEAIGGIVSAAYRSRLKYAGRTKYTEGGKYDFNKYIAQWAQWAGDGREKGG